MNIYVWDKKLKSLSKGTTSVKEVYVGSNKVRPKIINFATQWPCPNWFHVPLSSERSSIANMYSELSWWVPASLFAKNLKLPFSWYRVYSTANVSWWWYWYYWSSSAISRSWDYYASSLSISSTDINRDYPYWLKANWCSIRPFKNDPITPDSSRTKLYTWYWTWDAWIWHNSSLWLISISNVDWSSWITISDKNLWATTAYNEWDPLSESNSWYFYQRWNNYWFPYTWSVTTSSTQVNTTWYWPGNYYSSDTFIIRPSRPYNNWSSVQNDNLRWWVDWNVPVS